MIIINFFIYTFVSFTGLYKHMPAIYHCERVLAHNATESNAMVIKKRCCRNWIDWKERKLSAFNLIVLQCVCAVGKFDWRFVWLPRDNIWAKTVKRKKRFLTRTYQLPHTNLFKGCQLFGRLRIVILKNVGQSNCKQDFFRFVKPCHQPVRRFTNSFHSRGTGN